ncbi:MAG: carbon-nitrogen hydrolase family protein [Caldisericia bacterium]|nr:carbon-nitrogen hydrolase family protein [Caldisericia bacterium]
MKVALCAPRLTSDVSKNIETIEKMAVDASLQGVNVVIFPEATLTGLINNDDPEHDDPLCQEIPGEITNRLGKLCIKYNIWLALGLLEKDDGKFYDTAVLIKPDGSIALKYRRVQPHWHGHKADPEIYCQGTKFPKIQTPFGSVGFLICGDLFDEGVVSSFKNIDADWMFYLVAVSFEDNISNQKEWDTIVSFEYGKRVKMANTPALMVNYLVDKSIKDDDSYGGAFVISKDGEFLVSYPLGKEGMLIVDIEMKPDKQIRLVE